jgi:hypothetical protein
MADVFISYSFKDRKFVRKIHRSLKELKRDSWVDWRNIPPTSRWWKEILRGIEGADNFVFVISPNSVSSKTCRKEITHAAKNSKRLVPVLLREVPARDLPPVLAKIQWISFADTGEFERAVKALVKAIDTDLEWVRTHTRLLVRAKEWKTARHNTSFLLRGLELQSAVRWLAEAPDIVQPQVLALQLHYIVASQKWETGEIQRLRELNEEKNRQARIATARERVSYALGSLAEDPERSLLLSMHAVAATLSHDGSVLAEAEHAVHRALFESRIRLRIPGHETDRSVAWSPDGSRLVTGSDDNTARVWDLETGRKLLTLSGHGDNVRSVAWSPNGKRLATASADTTAKVWKMGAGLELLTFSGHDRDLLGTRGARTESGW